MEKTLRVLGGSEGSDSSTHSHSHSHSQSHTESPATALATGISASAHQNGVRSRGSSEKPELIEKEDATRSPDGPSKLSAYLNLFGDFVHNM